MSERDEEIIIEEDPIAPAPEVKVEGVPAKAPAKEITPEEGIEELKAKLAKRDQDVEAERNARAVSEARARDAETRAADAANRAQDSSVQQLESAKIAIAAAQQSLKGRLSQARADGDVEAEADIFAEISQNAARQHSLEMGIERAKQQPKHQAPAETTDVVEHFANSLSPRSGRWVREHPEFVRDPSKNRRMIAAHEIAVTDGLPVDSDDYFKKVEEILGVRGQNEIHVEEAQSPRRQIQPSAAPTSRSGASNNGAKPRTVTLTADQRDAAEASGLSYVDYAKNLLALKAEGRMQ